MKSFLRSKHFFFITLIYLVFVILLQFTNGWYQNFSDAVHYLWVADKYAEGDWQNAINTYWGPMTSWLLLLLKPIIAEPFVRFRVLQLLLGFTALLLINRILKKKQVDSNYTFLFSLIAIPLIVSFAWFYLTPDLLLLNGVLIAFLFFIKDNKMNWRQALAAAAIGAMMFYTKSVGLYIFIAIVSGKFISEKKQWNLKALFYNSLIAFFLLLFCAPWIILISKKHGSFTMGTSSLHNYKMNAPRITPEIYGEVGNPYHLGTLTEPNPANAFDACVEHAHQPYLSWEGMSKEEIRSYYFKIIIKNIKSARSMFFGLDTGSVFIVLLLIAFVINRKKIKPFLVENIFFLIVVLSNILLYLPFFYMDRYTWPGLISFFLLSILLLFYFPALKKNYLIVGVSTLFLLLNSFTLYKEYQYSLPEKPITEVIWKSEQKTDLKRTIWLCDKNDKRLGLVKGLIYYNHGQYLGALFYTESTKESIARQIELYHINSVVVLDSFPDSLLPKDQFNFSPLIESNAIKALHVEKRKNL